MSYPLSAMLSARIERVCSFGTQAGSTSSLQNPVHFGYLGTRHSRENQPPRLTLRNVEWDVSDSVPAKNRLFTFFQHWQILHKLRKTYKTALRNSTNKFPTGRHFAALAYAKVAGKFKHIKSLGQNNQWIQWLPTCDVRVLTSNLGFKAKGKPFVIDQLYLAGAQSTTIPYVPCGVCFEFLALPQYTPDCRVHYLTFDEEKQKPVIRVILLKDWLPLHKRPGNYEFVADADISGKLTPIISPSAAELMSARSQYICIDRQKELLRNLMQETITAYYADASLSNACQVVKKPPMTSGVILGPDLDNANTETLRALATPIREIKSDFNFSRSDGISADKFATAACYEDAKLLHIPEDELSAYAISYYGNLTNAMVPSLSTMGTITRHRGSDDTLILVIENGKFYIRTVRDYTPEVYNGSRNGTSHGTYYNNSAQEA